MKHLIIFSVFVFAFSRVYPSEIYSIYPGDSLEIKKWEKEKFVKEFGFNDTAKALINLFFCKNRKGKNQAIIGGSFLLIGGIAIAVPYEKNDDYITTGDLLRPVAEYGSVILGSVLTTTGVIRLKKYTKEKLYFLLNDYKNGILIPYRYKRKLTKKYITV